MISFVARVGVGFGVGLGFGFRLVSSGGANNLLLEGGYGYSIINWFGFGLVFSGGANNLLTEGGYAIINGFPSMSLYISNAPTLFASSLAASMVLYSFISLESGKGAAVTF